MSQFSALLLNAISIWFKKPHLLWFALLYIIFAFAIDPLTNSQTASPLVEFILFFGAMILMLFVHQFIIFGIGRASQNQAFNLEETSFKQWRSFIFFVLLSLPIIAVFGAGVGATLRGLRARPSVPVEAGHRRLHLETLRARGARRAGSSDRVPRSAW